MTQGFIINTQGFSFQYSADSYRAVSGSQESENLHFLENTLRSDNEQLTVQTQGFVNRPDEPMMIS